uniref:Secreted protein n=1 Tax=Macrostomum lignano TaxID=282301 RepID=A0A1I8JF39_9PLAT
MRSARLPATAPTGRSARTAWLGFTAPGTWAASALQLCTTRAWCPRSCPSTGWAAS